VYLREARLDTFKLRMLHRNHSVATWNIWHRHGIWKTEEARKPVSSWSVGRSVVRRTFRMHTDLQPAVWQMKDGNP